VRPVFYVVPRVASENYTVCYAIFPEGFLESFVSQFLFLLSERKTGEEVGFSNGYQIEEWLRSL
jgi:hypothetical protein